MAGAQITELQSGRKLWAFHSFTALAMDIDVWWHNYASQKSLPYPSTTQLANLQPIQKSDKKSQNEVRFSNGIHGIFHFQDAADLRAAPQNGAIPIKKDHSNKKYIKTHNRYEIAGQ